jgi:hypothetical protein
MNTDKNPYRKFMKLNSYHYWDKELVEKVSKYSDLWYENSVRGSDSLKFIFDILHVRLAKFGVDDLNMETNKNLNPISNFRGHFKIDFEKQNAISLLFDDFQRTYITSKISTIKN